MEVSRPELPLANCNCVFFADHLACLAHAFRSGVLELLDGEISSTRSHGKDSRQIGSRAVDLQLQVFFSCV